MPPVFEVFTSQNTPPKAHCQAFALLEVACLHRWGLDLPWITSQTAAMLIYKILDTADWQKLQKDLKTAGSAVDLKDGFIHFSTAKQAPETARSHFSGQSGLWLLAVDTAPLSHAIKWEKSRGGKEFPHLYESLLLRDVLWAKPLPIDKQGHEFPPEML